MIAAFQLGARGTYNAGSGCSVSVADMAGMVVRAAGTGKQIVSSGAALGATIVFTVVHHIGVSLIDPKGAFSHGAAQAKPVLWALIHAVFVLAEVVGILLLWKVTEQAQAAAAAAGEEATEQARERLAAEEERHALEAQQVEGARHRTEVMERVAQAAHAEADSLRQSANSLSGQIQATAAGMEQLAASVQEISGSVPRANTIAAEAVTASVATDGIMSRLGVASSEIAMIIDVIKGIAGQTNLLALNATIEAARAGESGRGFAVVAQEVKALAAQTASATKEISSQIAGMQVATQESVQAIKQIGTTISRISQIAATISASVDQQGGATQEIARNVEQAALGTSQVATNIVDVNHGARRTGSASAQVLSSAQSLSGESHRLKLEVDKFLDTVRAA
jgi:methyl-accepting chemotaxis protein